MRLIRSSAICFAAFALWAAAGRAESPPSPLRLIPAEADLLLEVKDPKRLADLVRNMDLLGQIQSFAIVKEQLDGTQARRGRQLLGYVEKALAAQWPSLLDRLAGGGVALGIKFADNPIFVLVLQGKEDKLLDRFLKLGIAVIEDELARQESKDKITPAEFQGVPGYKVGKDLLVARAGSALLLSNHKDAMAKALSLHTGKEKKSLGNHPQVAESDKLLPKDLLLRAWLNLAPIHASSAGKRLYKSPRDDAALTVLFGDYLDVFGRTPFVCAGLEPKKDGFLFTVRAPRGTDGMGADRVLKLPPEGKPGSRPLLEPKGVLYSSSFYLDVASIWKDRAKLFPKAQVAGLEAADKGAANAIARGVKLSGLLQSAGAYHRIVVVNQPKATYKKKPQQELPAFAVVTEMAQPDKFTRWSDAGLRAAGLLVTNQFDMKLEEETYKDYEIVGYRFDEKAPLKADVTDIRFNFSPCYVRVEDQFVFCSTIELSRELVDLLIAEKKQPGKGGKARSHDRIYSSGFANVLEKFSDQLITQIILDQAVPPKEAKEQVSLLVKLVRNLGALNTSTTIGAKDFRFDIRMTTK